MLVFLNPSLYRAQQYSKIPKSTYATADSVKAMRGDFASLVKTSKSERSECRACACLTLVSLRRPIAGKVAARATTVPCALTHLISFYFDFREIRQVLQHTFRKCLNSTYLEQSPKLSFLYKIFKQNLFLLFSKYITSYKIYKSIRLRQDRRNREGNRRK